MHRTRPSFVVTAAVLIVLIVLPMATAAAMVFFVADRFLVGIVLFFILFLLLIVIPYFALLADLVPANTWLEAYLETLNRIPFIQRIVRRPYNLLQIKGMPDLIHAVVQRRMQAEDWKQLHADYQAISLKLVILRGAASPDNAEMALHGLETHWRLECSSMIEYFIKLERLPDGIVKQEFSFAESNSNWLLRLRVAAEQMDAIIDECATPDDLRHRMKEVVSTLYTLELISSQLLNFLDARLQKTIKELDRDIEAARSNFVTLEQ